MLTDQQENFARAVALEGMNYSDAYRSCYNTETDRQETVWDTASKLASHPEVAHRITELRGMTASLKIMNAQERREKLTAIIEDPESSHREIMQAIDLLNKMDGEYVQKVQANVTYEDSLREVVGGDEY